MATATLTKEPWQMTQKEYVMDLSETFEPVVFGTQVGSKVRWRGTGEKAIAKQKADILRGAPEAHRYKVRQALSQGKPVPAEVLKDYPDLKPTATAEKITAPVSLEVTKQLWEMTDDELLQIIDLDAERMIIRFPKAGATSLRLQYSKDLKQGLDMFRQRAWEIELKMPTGITEVIITPGTEGITLEGVGRKMMRGEERTLAEQQFYANNKKLIEAWLREQLPKPTKGMPEAGLQPSMLEEVPAKEVRPEAQGKLVQARIDKGIALAKAFTLPEAPAKPRAENIEKGDFIKQEGTSYTGIVQGEGTIGKIAAWKVQGPRGETSLISKADAKLIAKEKPTPPTIAKLAKPTVTLGKGPKRSDRAMAIDRSLLAKQVVSVDDPRWLKRPNRLDVRGIDTPSRSRRSKGVYADKGRSRMSRKPHRNWKRIY